MMWQRNGGRCPPYEIAGSPGKRNGGRCPPYEIAGSPGKGMVGDAHPTKLGKRNGGRCPPYKIATCGWLAKLRLYLRLTFKIA